MTRRSRLTVTFVALVAVGLNVVSTTPRDPALAADPSLAQAQAQQQQLRHQIAAQRAQLAELSAQSATLGRQLDIAKAQLADVTAEYERVSGLWVQAKAQVADIKARLADLRAEITALDRQLTQLAADILANQRDLDARQALLQQHLRDAYEQSQTSLLEVLLRSDSLDEASTQVGYLLTVSTTDQRLADEIRALRDELTTKQRSLKEGRAALDEARVAAEAQQKLLTQREADLSAMAKRLAQLKAAAEEKRRQQEAALNATAAKAGNTQQALAKSVAQQQAADRLVQQLKAQEAARQAALAEARRRAAAEEEARRRAQQISARGFRWPEVGFHVNQEFGPTSFVLEPPYTYRGTYYAHFHAGIDIATGCGTPILAAATGVIAASGQPLMPWDTGYGVVIDHGNGIQSWYWHLQPRVIVYPGQPVTIGQVIGYEGTTGNSTGCHLHFAVNENGGWENPRFFLP
jgi:murein DD-endopeptidase MepM/ murein hydrolase activator NlpD